MHRWQSLAFAVCVLVIYSCGTKPSITISPDVTIQDVLDSLKKHSQSVRDLSGTALVRIKEKGNSQTAVVQFKYIQPDSFRLYIKGFAGMDLARITALGDSLTVYLPSDNLYFTTSEGEDVLGMLLPESRINLKNYERIFTGTLPSPEIMDDMYITLKHYRSWLELTLENDTARYRYVVEGKDLRPFSEEIIQDNVTVWRKTVKEYGFVNGVLFPVTIIFEQGGTMYEITFSRCSLNTGLTGKDLLFVIPSSAESVSIEHDKQQ
jgi:outer membrane lipoprotein-sorting protein